MPSATTFRRRRVAVAAVVLLLVTGAGATAYLSSTTAVGLGLSAGSPLVPSGIDAPDGPAADGEISDGSRVSVHDIQLPALANLDPDLLAAIQRAAEAAAADGVEEFYVTSGWRSPEYQARLLSEAVLDYGSQEEAARWVATPETSLHVSGDAIDIGGFDASYWLSLNGAAYGLCQIYANERWHYELRPDAVSQGCPEQYLDPTYDPRTQG
jgi:zinc D-Ala-D-Ala carboxypeptidase